MIEHENIFYLTDISEIGGVETFIYEMCKKYRGRDIAVVYKRANLKQLDRIKKYCRAYKHTIQQIKCKVAIINYDSSIIDFINADAKIYQVIHADYENPAYTQIPQDRRVYKYIGITKHIVESYSRITGNKNIILGYNPLTIESDKPLITLVSATRLSKVKGKDRMIKLANALDKSDINYIWYIFTNDKDAIDSPNVVYMKPRLDVGKWIEQCTYLVQLSDTEACSYSINEALFRNKPVIVTPLPYLESIGYKDGINGYTLDFNCNNLDELVKKIQNVPSFNFTHLQDIYGSILTNTKSRYEEEKKMKVKVRCIHGYTDLELGRHVDKEVDEWTTTRERADHLVSKGLVQILEVIKDEIKEDKKVPTKKVEKTKRK